MNLKTLVNANGKIIETQVPENWQAQAGQFSVTDYYTVTQTTNGVSHTLLKPVWNFETNEWTETATEQELQEAYPAQNAPEPTDTERINAIENALIDLMGGI